MGYISTPTMSCSSWFDFSSHQINKPGYQSQREKHKLLHDSSPDFLQEFKKYLCTGFAVLPDQ